MEIVIFLAAVSAANIFVGVEGYSPASNITILPYRGYQIQVTYGSSNSLIDGFVVHVNKNKPITVNEPGETCKPGFKQADGKWIFRQLSANLDSEDTINYWITLTYNGRSITLGVKSYDVHLRGGKWVFVPAPIIRPCGSTGYEISIGSDPGISLFGVHINKNKPITFKQKGEQQTWLGHGEKGGEWVYRDISPNLKHGDEINYWTEVLFERNEYASHKVMTYTIQHAAGPSADPSAGPSAGPSSGK